MSEQTSDQWERLQERLERIRQTPEYAFYYVAGDIGEQIFVRMEELGLNRKQLAERMGVSPARVTQVLRGSDNLTLKTIIAVAHALDATVKFELEPNAVEPSVDEAMPAAEQPARRAS